MNQAKVKAERRAIRRAFGPELFAVVNDHDKGIQTLLAAVQRLESLRANDAPRLDRVLLDLQNIEKADTIVLRRDFWGRLRWLVLGR